MAIQAYWTWHNLGRPFELAKPIVELRHWAVLNEIPVLGTIGNEEHLTSDRPQDHTPFSVTAWPTPLPDYIVTAIDLANVRGLGQAIEDNARAGRYPWLKYMNHSGQHLDSRDLDGDGKTWEEYPSSDEHVHLSIRTDWIDRSIGVFDPLGNDMELTDRIPETVGLDAVNAPNGYTVGQVLAQLVGSLAFGRRTLGPGQTTGGLPILHRERQLVELHNRLTALEAKPPGSGVSAEDLRSIVREEIRRAFADGGTVR